MSTTTTSSRLSISAETYRFRNLSVSASPQLPTRKATRSFSIKRRSTAPLSKLPTEMLLSIFELLPNRDLATLRGVSQHLRAVSESLLIHRLESRVKGLQFQTKELQTQYDSMYAERKPQLRHFRGFLRNLPSSHLTEVTWYTSPPAELLSVSECLCILKNGQQSVQRGSPGSWTEVKRSMSRYDFKTWFLNLPKTVESIDIQDVSVVQNIIMHDPTITYERLREVSMAGYHLLIVVAACLQFGTLAQDLKTKKTEMKKTQTRLSLNQKFLEAVQH